jgi:hypothetical protein
MTLSIDAMEAWAGFEGFAHGLIRANLAEDCARLECIDRLLAELEAATAASERPWTQMCTHAAHRIALEFLGRAARAGLPDLEAAASGLCRLATAQSEQDRHAREPIRAHVEAMRLLRLPEALARGRDELLDELAALRLQAMQGEAIAVI